MEYTYTNKVVSLDLNGIYTSVLNSVMTDKTIEYCRWDKDTELLTIVFTNTLSVDDKILLDDIVSNCPSISESPNSINLTSENGTRFKLTVDNDGVLVTEEII